MRCDFFLPDSNFPSIYEQLLFGVE